MREIMFRGKRLDNGEWIEGHLIRCENGRTRICESKTDIFCYEKDCSIIQTVAHETETFTVGQYTGLNDKYGKRIFEWDVVVCRQSINGNWIDEVIEIGYVEMKHGAFGLHRKQGYYRPFKDWLEDYEYEVIGNIHDNPELLEEEGGDM